MPPNELIETALRVLVAWVHGRKPVASDVEILQAARPSMAHLPPDELACHVMQDLNAVRVEVLQQCHIAGSDA